jgi:hypothetical protein
LDASGALFFFASFRDNHRKIEPAELKTATVQPKIACILLFTMFEIKNKIPKMVKMDCRNKPKVIIRTPPGYEVVHRRNNRQVLKLLYEAQGCKRSFDYP